MPLLFFGALCVAIRLQRPPWAVDGSAICVAEFRRLLQQQVQWLLASLPLHLPQTQIHFEAQSQLLTADFNFLNAIEFSKVLESKKEVKEEIKVKVQTSMKILCHNAAVLPVFPQEEVKEEPLSDEALCIPWPWSHDIPRSLPQKSKDWNHWNHLQEAPKKDLPKLDVAWPKHALQRLVHAPQAQVGWRLMAPPTRMKATKAKAKPPKAEAWLLFPTSSLLKWRECWSQAADVDLFAGLPELRPRLPLFFLLFNV